MQDLAAACRCVHALGLRLGGRVGRLPHVVIARVPKGEHRLAGSRCPRCGSRSPGTTTSRWSPGSCLRARLPQLRPPHQPAVSAGEVLTGVLAVPCSGGWVPAGPRSGTSPSPPRWWPGVHRSRHLASCLTRSPGPCWRSAWLRRSGIASVTWIESFIRRCRPVRAVRAIASSARRCSSDDTMAGATCGLLAAIGAWLGCPRSARGAALGRQGAIVGSILLHAARTRTGPPPSGHSLQRRRLGAAEARSTRRPFLSLAALEYLFFGDRLVSGWNHLLFRCSRDWRARQPALEALAIVVARRWSRSRRLTIVLLLQIRDALYARAS